MRILLVTPFPPDPGADHGGGALLGSLAGALGSRVELGLATLVPEGAPTPRIPGPLGWLGTAPVPTRRENPLRISTRLRMLWRWRSLPLVAAKALSPAMAGVLDRALHEFRPDVALVEMAQMAQYLPALGGIPTILTDHEAGCAANTRTGLGPLGDRRDRRLWRRFVRRFYPLATALQALTAEDAATLAALLDRPVDVRGPIFPVADTPVRPELAPPRALFVGDYAHAPNPEAAFYLARELLPRLRAARADVELWLAGPHSERIAGLGGLPGVRVVGFVPDLRALFAEARLLLAPLFSGAGLRIKCLAALAYGLPVVTNALGGRGVPAPAPARTVAADTEALAAAALALLESPERARDAGRAAHAWARAHVRADAVAEEQLDRIARLVRGR